MMSQGSPLVNADFHLAVHTTATHAAAVGERDVFKRDVLPLVGASPEELRLAVHVVCHHLHHRRAGGEKSVHVENLVPKMSPVLAQLGSRRDELAESRAQAGSIGPRRYDREYIRRFIQEALQAGYLVTYNHPNWSMEEPEEILHYDGFFSLELFNTGSMMINGHESNLGLYDRLLRHGRFPYVHGADDNHNKQLFGDPLCDSFGAWTMIQAPELSYPAIIHALENGDFYASTGPTIRELRFEGSHVVLGCSEARRIIMHMSPKRAQNVCGRPGEALDSAEFDIPGSAPYVYFSVLGPDGTQAHTRAFTRAELGI